jgi:hypothetical protein
MDVNARAHCVCFGLIIVCNFYLSITYLLGSIISASLNYLLHYIPQLGIVTSNGQRTQGRSPGER